MERESLMSGRGSAAVKGHGLDMAHSMTLEWPPPCPMVLSPWDGHSVSLTASLPQVHQPVKSQRQVEVVRSLM